MSLKSQAICPVPQETARVARAAYPKGNLYMQMRDVLGSIYTDEDFADVFPKEGQPAEVPWRLALVTVMQFVENRTSRQAADAVRGRIDWKYLLGLNRTSAGFDASVLSEFRARLIDKHAEELELSKMLTLFGQKGWRQQLAGGSAPILPMCWRRSALSTECCVCGKRWVLPSTVLRWLLPTGYVLTVNRSGSSGMVLAVKIRVLLWEKRSVRRLRDLIGQQGRVLLDALFDPDESQLDRPIGGDYTCRFDAIDQEIF